VLIWYTIYTGCAFTGTLIIIIESGTNSVCRVECLHLVLSHAGDTQHKHCIYCHDSLKMEQTVFIYIAINWVECLHIAACWRDTQHKHCGIYCDSLKVKQIVFVITIEWSVYNCCLLERHAASTAMTIEDPDWWHQKIIFKFPLNKSVVLHIPM